MGPVRRGLAGEDASPFVRPPVRGHPGIAVNGSILVSLGTVILRKISVKGNTIVTTNTIIAGSIGPCRVMNNIPTGRVN